MTGRAGVRITIFLLILCLCVPAAARDTLNILVIDSYSPELPWSRSVYKGLVSDRKASDLNIRIFVEYMDVLRLSSKVDHSDFYEYLNHKYSNIPVSGIISNSNYASDFVTEYSSVLADDVPVVLYTYNQYPTKKNDPSYVFIQEDIDDMILQTVVLALRQNPKAKEAVIIEGNDENSRIRSRATQSALEQENIQYRTIKDFSIDELVRELPELPDNTIVFTTLIFQDSTGRQLIPKEVTAMIAQYSSAPVYSYWSTFAGTGIVGGVTLDGEIVGRSLVQAVIDYTETKAYRSSYVTFQTYIDWNALKRHGISTDLIPPEAVILNEPINFWKQYKIELLTALVCLGLFTAAAIFWLGKLTVLNKQLKSIRAELEERVRIRTQELNSIIDTSVVGIMQTVKRRFTWVSRQTEVIFGYTREELIGQKTAILFNSRDDYIESGSRSAELLNQGLVYEAEYQFRKKNGEKLWCSFSGKALDSQNLSRGVIYVVMDITNRKQMENELRINRDRAELSNQAKTRFLANMSHEIRTPMNAIIGFAQIMLKDPRLTESQRRWTTTISKSGEHLLSLINDILDLSKIEAGKMLVYNEDFDVLSLMNEIFNLFLPQAEKKGIELILDIEQDFPGAINSDEKKISQILINLVGNALKYTDSGRVTIKAESSTVPEHLVFKVTDTGAGISDTDLRHIFESFARGDAGEKVGGTGLGLSISHSLAELMDGSLTIESRPEEGTTCVLTLPCKGCVSEVYGRQEVSKYDRIIMVHIDSLPLTILVADDNNNNRILLTELLEPLGIKVCDAVNGRDALERLDECHPDAVLMDLKMPVMDGFEALREIRIKRGSHFPVIAISASTLKSDETQAREVFDGYIRKPFKISELFRTLEEVLGISYEFHETETNDTGEKSQQSSAGSFSNLPEELRKDIMNAVFMGNLTEALDLINRKMKDHPQLADILKRLLAEYEYDRIMELLDLEKG